MAAKAKPQEAQYTIRNVPGTVDRALRRRAKESGKSLNQIVLEVLATGANEPLRARRDLSEIAGSLSPKEAARRDAEIRRQRQIDLDLWK